MASHQVAEELLQDVFVKIWKNINRYEPGKAALFTWMVSIARNTCIDHLRSKQHKNESLTFTGIPENAPEFSLNEEANHSLNKDIFKLSQRLDEKYREVIDLLFVLGYSQKEAAEKLNIPLGTVKTRSRAALNQLRNMFLKREE